LVSKKKGFTLIEIMVVVVIMGILAGVAVPKLSGLIEKSRQKIDLTQLYYIKDSINRHILSDDALDGFKNFSATNAGPYKRKTLNDWLSHTDGLSLLLIDISRGVTRYNLGNVGNDNPILKDVFKEMGLGDEFSKAVKYGASGYGNGSGDHIVGKALFISNALNKMENKGGIIKGNGTYVISACWKNQKPDSREIDVVLTQNNFKNPYKSTMGVCFSTDQSLCK